MVGIKGFLIKSFLIGIDELNVRLGFNLEALIWGY
jgi:hypothetical protein